MIRNGPGLRLIAAALLAALAAHAPAQDFGGMGGDDGAKVSIGEATASPSRAPAGTTVRVTVPLTAVPGWHVYAVDEEMGEPTRIVVSEWPEGLSAAGTTQISPAPHAFGPEGYEQSVHEGQVSVSIDVAVAADATPGARTLRGTVHFMACDESSCLPPQDLPWSVPIDVKEASKAHLGAVVVEPPAVAPGGTARIRIPVRIDEGWHIYGIAHEGTPATVTVASWPDGLSGGAVGEEPAATPHDNFGVPELIHAGEVAFTLDVRVADDAAPGPRTIEGILGWMTCNESMCTPSESIPFRAELVVAAHAADAAGAVAPPAAGADPGAGDGADGGSGITLDLILEAIGWGILTLLTPCVFPMLPITVSFFSKQKGPALPRSLVYGAGWVFTIVVIGLVFTSLLDVMARASWFNLAVGVLFIVLALSLFGMFDLRLPGFLSDWSTQRSSTGGYVGAFFMAVTLALTSFSCSMPFLGIMFRRFEGGDYIVAVVALTVYAISLALPFMLCSMFPAMLSALPQAGSWMNAVKVTMGFVELALAFKFLRTVDQNLGWGLLPRDFVLAIWIACCIGAALYLFGYLVLPHDSRAESIGVVRMMFAILFLACGVFMVPAVFSRPLPAALDAFLQTTPEELSSAPLGGGGTGGDEHARIAWVKNDWDGALDRGRARAVPVLFDFTGLG